MKGKSYVPNSYGLYPLCALPCDVSFFFFASHLQDKSIRAAVFHVFFSVSFDLFSWISSFLLREGNFFAHYNTAFDWFWPARNDTSRCRCGAGVHCISLTVLRDIPSYCAPVFPPIFREVCDTVHFVHGCDYFFEAPFAQYPSTLRVSVKTNFTRSWQTKRTFPRQNPDVLGPKSREEIAVNRVWLRLSPRYYRIGSGKSYISE